MRINVPTVLILAIAVGVCFSSCASTSSETAVNSDSKSTEIIKEEEKVPEIPNFVDWQYKGFGKDIPESAEETFAKIKAYEPANGIIVQDNLLVAFGKGTNSDQAVNVLEDSFEKHLLEYEENHEVKELSLMEDYWVKVNPDVWNSDQLYLAIRIYEIN